MTASTYKTSGAPFASQQNSTCKGRDLCTPQKAALNFLGYVSSVTNMETPAGHPIHLRKRAMSQRPLQNRVKDRNFLYGLKLNKSRSKTYERCVSASHCMRSQIYKINTIYFSLVVFLN